QDNLVIGRADGEAIDEVPVRVGGCGELCPGRAAVGCLEDARAADGGGVGGAFDRVEEALACTVVKDAGVRAVDDHASDGEAGEEVVERRPGGAAVGGFPDAAADGAEPHRRGRGRVNDDRTNTPANISGAEPGP